jgi:glycosyltransferase involved in cell wall biosynthesis
MKKKFPSISVCTIVRDEEKNLPRLFASVKGLADEVIVVDTGSKDNTVRVARALGAKVHHFAWRDDFSAARNESLKHATKDFILWLDGDDEVRREDHRKIRAHLRKHPGAGVYLRTYVEKEGRAMQLRIFPNHRGIRFEGRVHEQAIHSMEAKGIPTHSCGASIIHHGYNEPEALQEKLRRNRKLLEEETAERPGDLDAIFFLARTCLGLGDAESAMKHLDAVILSSQDDPSLRSRTVFNLALFEKGSVLAMLGRTEEALSVLSYGKSLFPGFVLIRFVLGRLHFERKEYREAFDELLPLKDETFEKETTPINVPQMKKWLYRALGVSALFVDDLDVAESCFLTAINGDRSDRAAYHHLAVARERNGDLNGAVAACRLGLGAAEDDAYMRKRLFFLLLKKEDFGSALECWETLNGGSADLDALSGRFFLSCKALDPEGIQLYYRCLQEKLSLAPVDFPQNLQATKERLKEIDEMRGVELFDRAISFLLSQAS